MASLPGKREQNALSCYCSNPAHRDLAFHIRINNNINHAYLWSLDLDPHESGNVAAVETTVVLEAITYETYLPVITRE